MYAFDNAFAYSAKLKVFLIQSYIHKVNCTYIHIFVLHISYGLKLNFLAYVDMMAYLPFELFKYSDLEITL